MFQCTLSNGAKTLEVCYGDGVAQYSFGRTGQKPELELSATITDLYYLPWNGVGRSIYEEIGFRNGDYDYTIHAALDRTILEDDDEWPLTGGVTVIKADQTIAEIDCDPESVTHSLDSFYEAKHDAGQCWRHQSFEWLDECPAQ